MSFEPIVPIAKSNPKPAGTKWARMRICLLMLFTFNFSLFIFNCGLDIEDPTPPSPPVWVQKSLPEEWPERGIDAHESGGIILEWEANQDLGIKAYIIYRTEYWEENDSLGEYALLSRFVTDLGKELYHVDKDVTLRTTYFYKLKAEDDSGNSSGFSDSIGISLLPQISSGTMNPNGLIDTLSETRSLSWRYTYNVEMENYCLTILTQTGELILREIMNPGNYVDGKESWKIPTSITLEPYMVYLWRIDTDARYVDGLETAASESSWATFLYAM
jgi:hypothetical protein